MTDPLQFATAGWGPDYRIGQNTAYVNSNGQQRLWRYPTPPAGFDGTIEDIHHSLDAEIFPNTAADGSVVPYPHPQVRTTTFDIPNDEMG